VAREPHIENGDHREHRHGIEDVHRPLMPQRISRLAHGVFDDAEDGPHHDEAADPVEHDKALVPARPFLAERFQRGEPVHPHVEDHGGDEEEAERDDLDEETGEHDGLAQRGIAPRDHRAHRGALDEEGQDVAEDEGPRQPVDTDDGVLLALDAADEAAEGHIDRRREQGRGEEDALVLDHVGHQLARFVVRGSPCGVAVGFNCIR